MKYFVELHAHPDIGVLQAANRFDPDILNMFLADNDCLVVEL